MRNLVLIVFMLFILVISGCSAENDGQLTGDVIDLPRSFWPGSFWVDIADNKGWFEEAGLNVRIDESGIDDYYQQLQDMVEKKYDGANFPPYDLVSYNLNGANLVAVIITDISNGVDGIVARDGIDTVMDLKGKKVGYNKGTYGEFLLSEVLDNFGLSLSDIIPVEVKVDDASAVLNSGVVDAVVSWEPALSLAVKNANGTMIFDSSMLPGVNAGLFVFHEEFIETRRNDVDVFVNVWHKTTKWLKENEREGFQIISDLYEMPYEDVVYIAKRDKVLSLRESSDAFMFKSNMESMHGLIWNMVQFMNKKGSTDKKIDSTRILNSDFVRNLE